MHLYQPFMHSLVGLITHLSKDCLPEEYILENQQLKLLAVTGWQLLAAQNNETALLMKPFMQRTDTTSNTRDQRLACTLGYH